MTKPVYLVGRLDKRDAQFKDVSFSNNVPLDDGSSTFMVLMEHWGLDKNDTIKKMIYSIENCDKHAWLRPFVLGQRSFW